MSATLLCRETGTTNGRCELCCRDKGCRGNSEAREECAEEWGGGTPALEVSAGLPRETEPAAPAPVPANEKDWVRMLGELEGDSMRGARGGLVDCAVVDI